MTDEAVLTKEMAERFLAGPSDVDLEVFTTIEDAAAEILSKHEGYLRLDGLTTLSGIGHTSWVPAQRPSMGVMLNP